MNICGQNIRKARKKLGLLQVDLSAALSVDYNIEITQPGILVAR